MKMYFFWIFVIALALQKTYGQEQKIKDTLFFDYNIQYVKTYHELPREHYIEEKSNNSFFFVEEERMQGLKPKKVLNLKRFVRKSRFYKRQTNFLYVNDFSEYLDNYIIFFKKGDTFIRVYTSSSEE